MSEIGRGRYIRNNSLETRIVSDINGPGNREGCEL